MATQKISQANSKMNVVAHQSVKEACIELFFSYFAPDADLLHVKAGDESCEIEREALRSKLAALGLEVKSITGTLPCSVAFSRAKNFLYLIEIADNSTFIDEKRKCEFETMFKNGGARCILITAIQNRDLLEQNGEEIAWGTSAWFAAEPSHMMHFGNT